MIFLKSNQVLSPFTWSKQVLDKYIKTVTCFCLWCFQAWGLYPGSGTIMASPVTCQGDARDWCHRCAMRRESGTSFLCWVISALTWAHIWPRHTVWAPKAACRESLHHYLCTETFECKPSLILQLMMFSSRDRWRCCAVGYLLPASWVNWKMTVW